MDAHFPAKLYDRTTARRLKERSAWLLRAFGFTGAYAAWFSATHLVVLTLVTYFLVSSSAYVSSGGPTRLQDISEVISSNEVIVAGFAALSFVILLRLLYPIASTTTAEIFTPRRFEKRFTPGFLQGAVLALGITVAFLLTGHYRYLGVVVSFEDSAVPVFSVLVRIGGLMAMVYFEEFIFRHKILRHLRLRLPEIYAATVSGVLYCAVKWLQFDLGIMHLITLFLISLLLSIRSREEGDFTLGAGFWAGLLVVFHALLGLPVFGNEFPGVVLIKYQGVAGLMSGFLGPLGSLPDSRTALFLTGGIGGPLSSFALQFLLLTLIGVRLARMALMPRATQS